VENKTRQNKKWTYSWK